MKNPFSTWLDMIIFCDDIVDAWASDRKERGLEVTKEEYMKWLGEELIPAMESAYIDWLAGQEDE